MQVRVTLILEVDYAKWNQTYAPAKNGVTDSVPNAVRRDVKNYILDMVNLSSRTGAGFIKSVKIHER